MPTLVLFTASMADEPGGGAQRSGLFLGGHGAISTIQNSLNALPRPVFVPRGTDGIRANVPRVSGTAGESAAAVPLAHSLAQVDRRSAGGSTAMVSRRSCIFYFGARALGAGLALILGRPPSPKRTQRHEIVNPPSSCLRPPAIPKNLLRLRRRRSPLSDHLEPGPADLSASALRASCHTYKTSASTTGEKPASASAETLVRSVPSSRFRPEERFLPIPASNSTLRECVAPRAQEVLPAAPPAWPRSAIRCGQPRQYLPVPMVVPANYVPILPILRPPPRHGNQPLRAGAPW